MERSTFVPTTERILAGTKRQSRRRPDKSPQRVSPKEVMFEPVAGALNQHIDEACRAKYAVSPYLAPMIGERAHAATIRITPTD